MSNELITQLRTARAAHATAKVTEQQHALDTKAFKAKLYLSHRKDGSTTTDTWEEIAANKQMQAHETQSLSLERATAQAYHVVDDLIWQLRFALANRGPVEQEVTTP